MNRTIVCYEIDGRLYFDDLADFNIIKYKADNIKVLESKYCFGERKEKEFKEQCNLKYMNP